MSVTIKEVAKKAGVSVASVSRYMNKKGYVSQQTGEKIAEAIEQLEYVPNEVARSLFQKKSKLVGVILPDIGNPYFPLVAKGIEEELNEQGLMMLLANTSDSAELLQSYLTTFSTNNVSGIITAVPLPSTTNKMKIVGVDRVYHGDFPKILTNDYDGGRLIAEKISQTPYQNILVVTSSLKIESANQRFKGLTQYFNEKKMEYTVFETGTFNISETDYIVKKLFSDYANFDTIVAATDYLALKIIQQATTENRKIPEDLQIVGYDGIPFSEMTVPVLTTVKQPMYEIGKQAAKKMVEILQDSDDVKNETIFLPIKWQEGGTLRK